MAGSLRLKGQWATASASTLAALAAQSTCGLSVWLKGNSLPAGSTLMVYSVGNSPLLIYIDNAGNLHYRLMGTGAYLERSVAFSRGTWHHLVLSWSPTVQIAYLDGAAIASMANGGMTTSQATKLQVGPGAVNPGVTDWQVADLAYWHGYAPSQLDVYNLLYRVSNPQSMGTPATHWWTLGGTDGATADPTADAGFVDQIGATEHFSNPTLSGGGSATYSTDTPVYISPRTVVDAHTGKSGQTVFLVPKVSTGAVNTTPDITVNGSPATVTSALVNGGFWCLGLGAPVAPTDVLSVSAPTNWTPITPGFTMAVRNSTGQVEYPVAEPKMKLGVNLVMTCVGDGTFCKPYANFAHAMRPWNWNGVVADQFDAVGNPTRFSPLTRGSIQGTWWTIDMPPGLYTLTWDSTDGVTDLAMGWQSGPITPTYHPELSNPAGTAGIGRTRVYDVPAQGAVLVVSSSTGYCSFANLQITGPASQPSADPFALDGWVEAALDIGSGKGPGAIRMMDATAQAGGVTDQTAPIDIQSGSMSSWVDSVPPARTVAISSIRPINLSVSPNLMAPGETVPWPVGWPQNGAVLFWGGVCVGEAVCSAPHPFGTGQMAVSLNLNTPSLTTAVGVVPMSWPINTTIWVTSPTTFIFTFGATAAGNANSYLTVGQTLTGASATSHPRGLGDKYLPFEFVAATASRFAGCYAWINVPQAASDAFVDALAALLTPFPCKVIVEYSNEVWNGNFPQWYFGYSMTRIMGLKGSSQGYYARRALQVGNRMRTAYVAAGRPATDVLIYGSDQFGALNGSMITSAIDCFHAGLGTFDVLGAAPYFLRWPWHKAQTSGWAVPQYLDVTRHMIELDPSWLNQLADFTAAVTRYETAIGKPVLRWGYEGDLEVIGVDDALVGTEKPIIPACDWTYHPDIADVERALWTSLQGAGFTGHNIYQMYDQPRNNGNNWGMIFRQEGQAGMGDGSDGKAVNTFTGAIVPGNVYPRAQAWRDWNTGGPAMPLTAGVASLGTVTPTSVSMTATDASGGTPPYTYQWQMSIDGVTWNPAVGSGVNTLVATVNGLVPATTYQFRLQYHDSAALAARALAHLG